MAGLKVLLPYNFEPYEEKSLDLVTALFPAGTDLKITLFNAYSPLPIVDMDASPELEKMKGPMATLSDELHQKEEGLKSAIEHLLQYGYTESQVDYIFKERKKDIAQEIIDTLVKGHYRVLILSRHAGKVSRVFSRSIHTKVLAAAKNTAVCIAT